VKVGDLVMYKKHIQYLCEPSQIYIVRRTELRYDWVWFFNRGEVPTQASLMEVVSKCQRRERSE